MLDQARCADETEGAAGAADCCVDGSGVIHFIRHEDIADTLARQGEGFAVGVADQCVFIIFRQIRNLDISVDELAVRLIDDEIDRMAVFCGFCFQESGEFLYIFFGIDNAGRVVRGVDEDAFGVLIDSGCQTVKIDLEGGRIGRCFDHGCACRFDEDAVFREVRSEDDVFVA